MDIKIKKEWEDGEITVEYNDITSSKVVPLKTLKLEPEVSNKSIQPENKLLHKISKLENKDSNSKNTKIEGTLAIKKTSNIPYIKTIQPEDELRHNIPELNDKLLNNKNLQNTLAIKKNPTITKVITSDITKAILIKPIVKTTEHKNEKVGISCSNISVNCRTEPLKSTLKPFSSNSPNKTPSSSYNRPIHSLPFSGATFLHTQVHSNAVLQSLLKDIVSLNNEKDDVDEDALNQEIARLRSKNNLPSFNAEVPNDFVFEDSDYSECSGDERSSYYDSKGSENYGKDSGYDNESQYSESLEDDNKSEFQDNLGNEGEKLPLISEPEYIDLDNYFGNKKRRRSTRKGSSLDIRMISKNSGHKVPNASTGTLKQTNEMTCPWCDKTLKSKKSYRHHTENGTGCLKSFPRNRQNKSNADRMTFTAERNSPKNKKSFNCIGNYKFFNTKEDFLKLKHIKEQLANSHRSAIKEKTPGNTCKECCETFNNNFSLERHRRAFHEQKRTCLFCDFVCNSLSEYNLHISSQHSKRAKKDSSSDSDGIEIIEIEDGD